MGMETLITPNSVYAPLQSQESTLLNIPAEVRNAIYEAMLASPTTVAMCYRSKRRMAPVEHPVLRTCRQIREEFLDAWTERAPHQATTVVVAIRNLEIGDVGKVKEALAALPPLVDDSERTFIMSFHITNHFEKSVRENQRQKHRVSDKAGSIKFFTNVAFNYATLDIGHIERIMRSKLVPPNVLHAFLETKQRYRTQRLEQRLLAKLHMEDAGEPEGFDNIDGIET